MACCPTLVSILENCDSARKVGGLQTRMYFGNKCQIADITFVGAGVKKNAVDSITMITGARFWEIDSARLQNNTTTTINNGLNVNFTQAVTGTIRGIDQEQMNFISDMVLSEVVFILQTRSLNNDATPELLTIVLGAENGLQLTEGSITSGQAFEDLAGTTGTWSGAESLPHRELVPAAGTIAAFIAALLIPAP